MILRFPFSKAKISWFCWFLDPFLLYQSQIVLFQIEMEFCKISSLFNWQLEKYKKYIKTSLHGACFTLSEISKKFIFGQNEKWHAVPD